MHESLITKKVIAYSLKKLMQEIPFEKISIRQIMETAEIRRQTFYDHFQDKYELLNWIYRQDISENISDFLDYEESNKVILRILEYFYNNQIFYRNALSVMDQNSFDHYFFIHTKELLLTIIRTISSKQVFKNSESELAFLAEFYSHSFVGLTKNWLLTGCKTPTKELAQKTAVTLNKSIRGALENI